MAPAHKKHRKQAVARNINRPKVRRWLFKLDKIFIRIEIEKKKKKGD